MLLKAAILNNLGGNLAGLAGDDAISSGNTLYNCYKNNENFNVCRVVSTVFYEPSGQAIVMALQAKM